METENRRADTLYKFLSIVGDTLPLRSVSAVAAHLNALHHTPYSRVAQLAAIDVEEWRLSRQHCILQHHAHTRQLTENKKYNNQTQIHNTALLFMAPNFKGPASRVAVVS